VCVLLVACGGSWNDKRVHRMLLQEQMVILPSQHCQSHFYAPALMFWVPTLLGRLAVLSRHLGVMCPSTCVVCVLIMVMHIQRQ
jgi:hypothetical protein